MRIFDFLIALYPADYREEFAGEMRAVFSALVKSRPAGSRSAAFWFSFTEFLGLLRGAANEHLRLAARRMAASWRFPASLAGGAVFASGMHLLMYWFLVPPRGKAFTRLLEQLASPFFILCVVIGVAAGQQQAQQDPAALDTARSIYAASFIALREARTLDDMRKLAGDIDSPDWISVDRFGRTILTREEADRDLKSLLALPPERRAAGMDIIWAEKDSDRLIVVAWMMPNQSERVDSAGDYGPKGASHKLTRGTLIRDIFVTTGSGWRRIRHDKLLPNDTVLAVDGLPRILPPLDESHRVAPAK